MSAPVAFALPPPSLGGTKVSGNARIDRPFAIGAAAPTLPGGVALPAAADVGAFIYRSGDSGEEIWNAVTKRWSSSPGDDALGQSLAPLPLRLTSDADHPWVATLDAAALVDAQGAAQFEIAAAEAGPRYFARAGAGQRSR